MPGESLRVFIYGSCVSRDAFELFDPTDQVELVEYVARSSMISAMSKRPFEGVNTPIINSQWRRHRVQWGLESAKVKDSIAEAAFDLILIDLIDERYPLLRRDRQTFATVSSEFLETGFVKTTEKTLNWDSAYREVLWRRAWKRLARQLNRVGKLDAVRLNRVFWATKMSDGTDYPIAGADRTTHERINALLERMYAWITEDIDPNQIYDYEDTDLTADIDHIWGTAPFHYPLAYNQSLKAKILAERDRINAASQPGQVRTR
jgi:hypothetical protein